MDHANAPLTPAGRLRLVRRCEHQPLAHVAAKAGISRQCLTTWKHRLDPQVVGLIEGWRREHKWTARQLTAELARHGHVVSVSTVGRWLVRLGINQRRDMDPTGASNRAPGKITARYPGHMVHLNVTKGGRTRTTERPSGPDGLRTGRRAGVRRGNHTVHRTGPRTL